MEPSNYTRATLFLSSLRRHCQPLSKTLEDAKSTIFELSRWLNDETFQRKLKQVMRHRRQIHQLSTSLTQFWAADQFTAKLQNLENVALELLRKTGQAPSKAAEEETTPERSFVHPDVPAAEVGELMDDAEEPAA